MRLGIRNDVFKEKSVYIPTKTVFVEKKRLFLLKRKVRYPKIEKNIFVFFLCKMTKELYNAGGQEINWSRKIARTDHKVTLVKTDFSMNAYKNIQKKNLDDWVPQPKNFFILSKALVNYNILTTKFWFGCWKTLKTGIFYLWAISVTLFWKFIWTKQKQ